MAEKPINTRVFHISPVGIYRYTDEMHIQREGKGERKNGNPGMMITKKAATASVYGMLVAARKPQTNGVRKEMLFSCRAPDILHGLLQARFLIFCTQMNHLFLNHLASGHISGTADIAPLGVKNVLRIQGVDP